jgi:hypothetical protein
LSTAIPKLGAAKDFQGAARPLVKLSHIKYSKGAAAPSQLKKGARVEKKVWEPLDVDLGTSRYFTFRIE